MHVSLKRDLGQIETPNSQQNIPSLQIILIPVQ